MFIHWKTNLNWMIPNHSHSNKALGKTYANLLLILARRPICMTQGFQ